MGLDYKWDTKRARDRHLMPGGPKRILTIDGGGIRGLLSCGILKQIEETLRERQPTPETREAFVLADYYDFIGGTSTGSIVAAWLALGKRVSDLQDLYMNMGSGIFGNSRRFGGVFIAKFDSDRLENQLKDQLGDTTLESDRLVTGFGVTAKRMDTGSAWLIANNPKAPYWDGSKTDRPNGEYKLRHVVRASAAAPAYFDHVDVPIEIGKEPGAFMDGAVAGLNNPSVAFWLYTTLPGYGLAWPTGADKLLITSVGTGEFRKRYSARQLDRMPAVQSAVFSLAGSIQDVAKNQLLIMQALSKPLAPYPINTEVDSLADQDRLQLEGIAAPYCITPEPLFSFQRYDVQLDEKGLQRLGISEGGEPLGPRMIKNLQAMDCANQTNLNRLKTIGEIAGERFVRPDHFPKSFDIASGAPASNGPPPAPTSIPQPSREALPLPETRAKKGHGKKRGWLGRSRN